MIPAELPPWIGVMQDWHQLGDDPFPFLIGIGPDELKSHALVIGSTGAGKTTFLHHLIAQDLTRGHGVVVLDLRGGLANDVISLCAGSMPVGRVRFLDLREKVRPLGFNPLAISEGEEPYFAALGVLDAIAQESESWGVQLAETLRYALMLLAEAGARLTDLERLFYDRAFRRSLLSSVTPSPTTDFWVRYNENPARQETMAAAVLNKTSMLTATKTLRAILGHATPLDLTTHLNTPGSVLLVSLAVDEVHGAGRMFGNFLLSSICREIFARVRYPEASRCPVRIYLDEFEHFLSPDIEMLLVEARKYAVSLVLAHQSLVQLNHRMRSLILGNVGLKACFRCGREDARTLTTDITGEPDAFNLHDLPTGHCLLWVKGYAPGIIEANEPIVSPHGLSAADYAYLDQLRLLNGDPQPLEDITQELATPIHRLALPRRSKGETVSLEDWLCG